MPRRQQTPQFSGLVERGKTARAREHVLAASSLFVKHKKNVAEKKAPHESLQCGRTQASALFFSSTQGAPQQPGRGKKLKLVAT